MNEKSKALILGVFITVALLLVIWLILFLGPTPGDGEQTLRVRFTNIDRILRKTRVTYGGRPIGYVDDIRAIADPRSGPSDASGRLYMYELVLKVDSSVKVFSYDEIVFAASGLLGEKSIAIIPKSPPFGAPDAIEVTNEILYAKSEDKIEEALSQITLLSNSFQNTLQSFHGFFNENEKEFKQTICEMHTFLSNVNESRLVDKVGHSFVTLDKTMARADSFLKEVSEKQILDKTAMAFTNFQSIAERIDRGEGTLGRLLTSNSLYFQITAVMAKLETVLNDISNYGLLFQYDKNWKRRRAQRIHQMCAMQTPCDFMRFFDEELTSVNVSLGRTEEALCRLQTCQTPISDPCLTQGFLELLSKVEHLRDSLKNYTEMLMAEYCGLCK